MKCARWVVSCRFQLAKLARKYRGSDILCGPGTAYLAPTLSPAGYPLTRSVARSPFPASERHSPGNPRREIAGIKPEHPFSVVETPKVRFDLFVSLCSSLHLDASKHTFSSSDNWATNAFALVYDSAQSPVPVPLAENGGSLE
jgi:hypothetical protein